MTVTILSGRLEAEGDEPHDEQASDDEEQSALEMARTALREAAAGMGPGSGDFVCPGDPIHVLHDDGFLRCVAAQESRSISASLLPPHTQRCGPTASACGICPLLCTRPSRCPRRSALTVSPGQTPERERRGGGLCGSWGVGLTRLIEC